jgi:hypothetical protein
MAIPFTAKLNSPLLPHIEAGGYADGSNQSIIFVRPCQKRSYIMRTRKC